MWHLGGCIRPSASWSIYLEMWSLYLSSHVVWKLAWGFSWKSVEELLDVPKVFRLLWWREPSSCIWHVLAVIRRSAHWVWNIAVILGSIPIVVIGNSTPSTLWLSSISAFSPCRWSISAALSNERVCSWSVGVSSRNAPSFRGKLNGFVSVFARFL